MGSLPTRPSSGSRRFKPALFEGVLFACQAGIKAADGCAESLVKREGTGEWGRPSGRYGRDGQPGLPTPPSPQPCATEPRVTLLTSPGDLEEKCVAKSAWQVTKSEPLRAYCCLAVMVSTRIRIYPAPLPLHSNAWVRCNPWLTTRSTTRSEVPATWNRRNRSCGESCFCLSCCSPRPWPR